jgi:octaprenyl-diphosphate synthase
MNAPLNLKTNIMPLSLHEMYRQDLKKVDEIIGEMMGSKADTIKLVGNHIYGAGGKRIRPLLTLCSAGLLGPINSMALDLASSVELIHTATLLHDDVIDMANLRRGLETANARWGNTVSILVGDYLFSCAFRLMVRGGRMELLDILSSTSSTIAEGEVLQLSTLNNTQLKQEVYLDIIKSKTAALFGAACKVGGLSNNCTPKEGEILREFGESVGMAFQIIDDILDYDLEAKDAGKEKGNDFFEGKITLPVILVNQKQIETAYWKTVFANVNRDQQDFLYAASILQTNGILELCRQEARNFTLKAFECLKHFQASETKEAIEEFLNQSLLRVV